MGVFPAESEAVDNAGGEVVDEDIALGEKGVHEFLAVLVTKIDGGAELVAVHVRVEGAVGLTVGDQQLRLDLDDFRAVEAEEHRANRPGKEACKICDADAGQQGIVLRVSVAGGGGGDGLAAVLRFRSGFRPDAGQAWGSAATRAWESHTS